MGYLYFKVDERAVRKKLEDEIASKREVREKAMSIATNLFNRSFASLMKDFNEHKITQEIRAGNSASNSSETLNGHGNLFSFLGFYEGEDPTEDLVELFSKISIHYTSHKRNVIKFDIVNVPTNSQIKSATRMHWGSEGWALAVENGDFKGGADLAHFIFTAKWPGSRSQAGFQVKGYEFSEEQFSPKPYLSEILERFQNRVLNSRSKFLV